MSEELYTKCPVCKIVLGFSGLIVDYEDGEKQEEHQRQCSQCGYGTGWKRLKLPSDP